jgi:hypothetical protein
MVDMTSGRFLSAKTQRNVAIAAFTVAGLSLFVSGCQRTQLRTCFAPELIDAAPEVQQESSHVREIELARRFR